MSQICTLPTPFEADIEQYSRAGLRSVEVWLTKLEVFLAKHSIDRVKKLFADHFINPAVASFQGGLITGPSVKSDQAWRLFSDRIQLCHDLKIGTMVVACDIKAPFTMQNISEAEEAFARIAKTAGQSGIRIAIEFQKHAAFGNNLQTVAAMVNQVDSPYLGICLDAFHFCAGPSKLTDLGYLNRDNLFHVQVSDIANVPREFACDSDRIVPGDGDFELSALVKHLRKIDYSGCISLELMNPQIWQIPAQQVAEVALQAVDRLCSGR